MTTGKESVTSTGPVSEHVDRINKVVAQRFRTLPEDQKEALRSQLKEIMESAYEKFGTRLRYMGAWEVVESLTENPDDSIERVLKPYVDSMVGKSDIKSRKAHDVLYRGIQGFIDDMSTKAKQPKTYKPIDPLRGISTDFNRTRGTNLSETSFDRPLNLKRPGRRQQ